jgi:hypothetical protein
MCSEIAGGWTKMLASGWLWVVAYFCLEFPHSDAYGIDSFCSSKKNE